MRIHIYTVAAVFLLLAPVCLVPAAAADDAAAYAPDRVIVKYLSSENLNLSEVLHADFPVDVVANFSDLVPGLQVLKLPAGVSVEDAIVYLGRIPGVEYVEPDYYVSVSDMDAGTAVPTKSPVSVFAVIAGGFAAAMLIRRT